MQNLRVLLADDDNDDRGLFANAMAEIDSSVIVTLVEDGDKLMKELSQGAAPNLIFLDLNMPMKNGRECLQEITRNVDFKKIPVIVYSTSVSPAEMDEAWSIGVRCFVRKPDSYRLLKEILATIIHLDFNDMTNQQKGKLNFNL